MNVKTKPSASSFEDVHVDDHDESPQKKSHHHHTPKRHNFNQEMLLESMLDDGNDHHHHQESQEVNTNLPVEQGFLLLDKNERLTVSYFTWKIFHSKTCHTILGQSSI